MPVIYEKSRDFEGDFFENILQEAPITHSRPFPINELMIYCCPRIQSNEL